MKAKEYIIENKTYLLKEAPKCKDLKALTAHCKIARSMLYRYIDADPVFKQSLMEVLGTNYITEEGRVKIAQEVAKKRKAKKSRKTNLPEGVEVPEGTQVIKQKTVTVIVPEQRQTHAHYTLEERRQFVDAMCELFEQGVSWDNAAKAVKVPVRTFYKWINIRTSNYDAWCRARYEEAMTVLKMHIDHNALYTASNTFLKKLEDSEVTEVTRIGKVQGDGTVKTHTVKQTTRTQEASIALVKMTMQSLTETFKPRINDEDTKADKEEDIYYIRKLSDEELEAEIAKHDHSHK